MSYKQSLRNDAAFAMTQRQETAGNTVTVQIHMRFTVLDAVTTVSSRGKQELILKCMVAAAAAPPYSLCFLAVERFDEVEKSAAPHSTSPNFSSLSDEVPSQVLPDVLPSSIWMTSSIMAVTESAAAAAQAMAVEFLAAAAEALGPARLLVMLGSRAPALRICSYSLLTLCMWRQHVVGAYMQTACDQQTGSPAAAQNPADWRCGDLIVHALSLRLTHSAESPTTIVDRSQLVKLSAATMNAMRLTAWFTMKRMSEVACLTAATFQLLKPPEY